MSSTCYEVSVASRDDSKKWIKVALSDADDTTREFNTRKRIQTDITKDTGRQQQPSETDAITSIPESVLQFERQMKKLAASDRASKTNVTIEDHLITLYADEHVVVTNKPSGILCVPGVNRYRSLLDLVRPNKSKIQLRISVTTKYYKRTQ
jgi:23S rRNA-/tRNA-specific pseudouridylate synthase